MAFQRTCHQEIPCNYIVKSHQKQGQKVASSFHINHTPVKTTIRPPAIDPYPNLTAAFDWTVALPVFVGVPGPELEGREPEDGGDVTLGLAAASTRNGRTVS